MGWNETFVKNSLNIIMLVKQYYVWKLAADWFSLVFFYGALSNQRYCEESWLSMCQLV